MKRTAWVREPNAGTNVTIRPNIVRSPIELQAFRIAFKQRFGLWLRQKMNKVNLAPFV